MARLISVPFTMTLLLLLICLLSSSTVSVTQANEAISWESCGTVRRLGVYYGIKKPEVQKADTNTTTTSAVPQQPSLFSILKQGAICLGPGTSSESIERVMVPCKEEKTVFVPKAIGGKFLRSADGAAAKPSFTVEMNCLDDNSNNICDKAKKAFNMASRIISNVLILDAPLVVNATIFNFCKRINHCIKDGKQPLGKAAPARTMIIKDSDGISRVYPQSLIKQLPSQTHPAYDKYDIVAEFNSDANFWFDGDGQIKGKQSDFLFVAVHELIHGLGFTTSWKDYVNEQITALTPNPLPANSINDPSAQFQFSGFFENAFDRYLVELPSLSTIPKITKALNGFNHGVGTIYSSQFEFIDTLTRSPEYAMAQYMLNISTTAGKIGFMPKNGKTKEDVIVLETNLPTGFSPESSIAHVSYPTYSKSADFLMRYLQDAGTLLKDDVADTGNYAGGPMGPKLLAILETLGYKVNKNPAPIAMEMNATNSVSSTLGNTSLSVLLWTTVIVSIFAML
ncbi:hypothetical protein BDF19DRAFT_412224 [Syncephalis fuscata]|nr:hypothetical protein BDF19DRAFT_412224 [Syncephalis fuscata]